MYERPQKSRALDQTPERQPRLSVVYTRSKTCKCQVSLLIRLSPFLTAGAGAGGDAGAGAVYGAGDMRRYRSRLCQVYTVFVDCARCTSMLLVCTMPCGAY